MLTVPNRPRTDAIVPDRSVVDGVHSIGIIRGGTSEKADDGANRYLVQDLPPPPLRGDEEALQCGAFTVKYDKHVAVDELVTQILDT